MWHIVFQYLSALQNSTLHTFPGVRPGHEHPFFLEWFVWCVCVCVVGDCDLRQAPQQPAPPVVQAETWDPSWCVQMSAIVNVNRSISAKQNYSRFQTPLAWLFVLQSSSGVPLQLNWFQSYFVLSAIRFYQLDHALGETTRSWCRWAPPNEYIFLLVSVRSTRMLCMPLVM